MTAACARSATVHRVDWSRIRERLRGMPSLAIDVALTTAVLLVTLVWIAAQDPDTGGGLEGFDAFAAVLVVRTRVSALRGVFLASRDERAHPVSYCRGCSEG